MPIVAGTTPKPTDFFAGFTSDGTSINIPIADIVGLTAAEADAANGNGMELIHKLLQTVGGAIESTPEADRPANMVYTPGDLDPQVNGQVRVDYNFNFLLDVDLSNANVQGEAAIAAP